MPDDAVADRSLRFPRSANQCTPKDVLSVDETVSM